MNLLEFDKARLDAHKPFRMAEYCAEMETLLGNQDGPARPFWKALSFAVSAHEGQKRKSGEIYVSHPCAVAMILVKELGVNDPETLAAAILHDTVEDVPDVTIETIGEHFGRNVAAIVEGCTKITDFSGDRQTFYKLVHRKLFSGAASRVETMFIKLADRLHNLRTMESMPKDKRQKIADETLDIYAPMAKVMGLFELKRELYNLALIYKFPRQSSRLIAQIKKISHGEEVAEIRAKIQEALEYAWISADIYVHPKGLWAYYDAENNVLRREIGTPMEIILAVKDIQACYRTMGVVNQIFPPIPRTIRDFIANPKPTGYQSLHARANIKGTTYLFKFRTDQMYHVGRTGVVRAWLEQRKFPSAFEKEIREMFDILGGESDISYRDVIAASRQKEIYTFTPKGARICLPKQSVVLDFAFKVHTEVGKRCIAAVVGQNKVSPDYQLQDGDRVQVLTQDAPVEFDPQMQALCQSPKARSELARMFRFRREGLCREIGRSIVAQEMKRYGMPVEILASDDLADVLEPFYLVSLDELHQQVGEGRLNLKEIVAKIKDILYAGKPTLQPPTGALNRIELETLDPACIKLSHCCDPIPTEKGLFGLLSERGLSVHTKDCTTFKSLSVQREDVVEVRWNHKKTLITKEQTLIVLKSTSRNRILMMLGVAPAEMRILQVVALAPQPSGDSAWEIIFQVDTLQGLRAALAHLAKANIDFEFALEQ